MFKYIAFFFAVLAVAFAAPKPGFVAPYAAAPLAYSAGYVGAPAAYSAYGGHYAAAPVASAYAAPVAYSGYGGYHGAYNPVAYSSYVY